VLDRRYLDLRRRESELQTEAAVAEEEPAADGSTGGGAARVPGPKNETKLRGELDALVQRVDQTMGQLEGLGRNLDHAERLIDQADADVHQLWLMMQQHRPQQMRGYLRDPVSSVQLAVRVHQLRARRRWIQDRRRMIDERRAQLGEAREIAAAQQEQLADIRQSLERQRRRAGIAVVAVVTCAVVVVISGTLLAPPAEAVAQAVLLGYLGVYLVTARGRERIGRRSMAVYPLLAIGAFTIGLVFQSFISPRGLGIARAQTSRGVVSGVLIASTDLSTTIGLSDCRIETLPAASIVSVTVRSAPRPTEKSVGTLLFEALGLRGRSPTVRPLRCHTRKVP
jgi:hypothetical protein